EGSLSRFDACARPLVRVLGPARFGGGLAASGIDFARLGPLRDRRRELIGPWPHCSWVAGRLAGIGSHWRLPGNRVLGRVAVAFEADEPRVGRDALLWRRCFSRPRFGPAAAFASEPFPDLLEGH